jgi:hypothetical protein
VSEQDHAKLCSGTTTKVVEVLGTCHETAQCAECGRLVTTYFDATPMASRPGPELQPGQAEGHAEGVIPVPIG